MVQAPRLGFGKSLKIGRLADLRLAALAGDLCSLSPSVLVVITQTLSNSKEEHLACKKTGCWFVVDDDLTGVVQSSSQIITINTPTSCQ